MNKLLKMKDWLSVAEAAVHLSQLLKEQVSKADIYGLAIDAQLQMSVNFVNHAYASSGTVVSIEKALSYISEPTSKGKLPKIVVRDVTLEMEDELADEIKDGLGEQRLRRVISALHIGENDYLNLDDRIIKLSGIYDLLMVGSERIEVERLRQEEIHGPIVELTNLEGAFVKSNQGQVFQVKEQFSTNDLPHLKGLDFYNPKRYYPGDLPNNSLLVVRTTELIKFSSQLNSIETKKVELDPRTERAFLNIIGALTELVRSPQGGRPALQPSQAQLIQTLQSNHPAVLGLSKRNLEKRLAQAVDSLKQ